MEIKMQKKKQDTIVSIPLESDLDTTPTKHSRLIPIPDWHKFHPWPPIGGLRHLNFHKHTNGFSKAFLKVGNRVLVHENIFFECIEEKNESA
jgi:hypothetical protein